MRPLALDVLCCWFQIPHVEGSHVHLRSEALTAAANRGAGAATAQSSTPMPSSTNTPISAERIAAWTAAEKESLRKQIADFPGLHELVRQNVVMLEDVRQLMPERGGPSLPSTRAGGISLGCQESLKKLDILVNMATILQQVAVSLAVICTFAVECDEQNGCIKTLDLL